MFIRVLSELGRLSLYFMSFILGVVLVWFSVNKLFFAPFNPDAKEVTLVQVLQGEDFKTITQRLEEQGVLKHWWSSFLLARLRNTEEQKKLEQIPVGEYRLSASMTPEKVLEEFISGNVVYYEFTVPDGATLKEIATIIGETGLVGIKDVTELLYESRRRSQGLILDLGLAVKSLEGYIFPDTYKFTRPITTEEVIKRMYQEGNSRITDELRKRAADLTFTFHDIRTLASIIEKETSSPAERARISSVFHNRLRIGMPLQSDPTVIYGIADFDGNLTKDHLRTNSPYNTYLNTGLPPTPICNPGLAAIKAALYPDDTEYVYFVAKNDGSGEHYFSTTYKEHQKAVQVFQMGKSPALLMNELVKEEAPAKPKRTVSAPEPKKPKKSSTKPRKNVKPKKKPRKRRFRGLSQIDPVRPKNEATESEGEIEDPVEALKAKYR